MEIKYLPLTFCVEAIDELMLPAYKGSTLRGGFGLAFRKVVCALKKMECTDCLLKTKCAYPYIFETSPPDSTEILSMDKYEAAPHPFVIEPPLEEKARYYPGEKLNFGLLLIGRAVEYLPYFIFSFDILGEMGIGKKRSKFKLNKVTYMHEQIYSVANGKISYVDPATIIIPETLENHDSLDWLVQLKFCTPARIRYQRNLAVTLEFHILIRNLLRRFMLLHYFHMEKRLLKWEPKEIIAAAYGINIYENNLRWYDWERYSLRQKTRMKLGGLIGTISYQGKLKPFLPFLQAGEILHAGKGTAFGLGKYCIMEIRCLA